MVLLAFAGCHRGPAIYEPTENPREVVVNAEKFVNQVAKKSKHYSAEDWQVAVEQFVVMSKNYVENLPNLTAEEQMRFDNARVQFMGSVSANGTLEIAGQVKDAYSRMVQ